MFKGTDKITEFIMNKLQTELLSTLTSCLCPPGDGVYTMNTAKERKQQLQQAIFP